MNLPEQIVLRDRRMCMIDRMAPEHANAYHVYQTTLAQETIYISTQPHEVKTTDVLAEQARTFCDSPGHVWLAAFDADSGNIIADCMARCVLRDRMRHVATIGVGVLESHQRLGLGRALMNRIIDWASADEGTLKLQLSMFADNTPAMKLYESLGFKREGLRVGSFIQPDGTLHDEVLMGRWLGVRNDE